MTSALARKIALHGEDYSVFMGWIRGPRHQRRRASAMGKRLGWVREGDGGLA